MPSTLSVRDDRRSRSKSPGGRSRDRSHSREPPRKEHRKSKYSESESESEDYDTRREKRSSKKYYEERDDDRRQKSSKRYGESESEEDDRRKKSSKSKKRYDDKEDDDRPRRKKDKDSKSRRKDDSESEGSEDINISIHRKSHKEKDKREEREDTKAPQAPQPYPYAYASPTGYAPDPRQAYHETRHMSYQAPDPRYIPGYSTQYDPRNDPNVYLQGHSQVPDHQRTHSFSSSAGRPVEVHNGKQYIKTYNANGQPQFVEIQSGKNEKHERDEKRHKDENLERRDKRYYGEKHGSIDEGTKKLSRLAIGGGLGAATLGANLARHGSNDGGRPPASPMLEAYKGTYQSISPMPGALVLSRHDSDVSDLDALSSGSDNGKDDLKRKIKKLEHEKKTYEKQHLKDEKQIEKFEHGRDRKTSESSVVLMSPTSAKKRVTFYDPIPDAKKIAAVLQGTSVPNTKPLILILPHLSTDDLFALRAEYKNHAKVAGQGINIAKHIKMRISGNLGKVMYATALGRWESEAYFANSYYFSGTVRRELLIESLMGRPNSDIREIKRVFKDKKYDNDLVKCMKAELKADKFRNAILLALEERRALESEGLDFETVQRDVTNLYRALTAGSESAMIEIIVVRSDAHLKEVLAVFQDKYQINFAREMISKSRNLVVSIHPLPEPSQNSHTAGGDFGTHSERGTQPTDARCDAPSPSHLGDRSGQRTGRAFDFKNREIALGTQTSGES